MSGFNDLFGNLFAQAADSSPLAREWMRTAELLDRQGLHQSAADARVTAQSIAGAYIRGGAR